MAAAAVALSCLTPACSSGLGGLEAASHDAGNPDSSGSGGTAGGAGAAGASTAGSGGTAASGGAAGADAGSEAGDAGTFTCTPKGSVFDVLTSNELGGAPIVSSSLLVVDGTAPNGFGSPDAYVVVATASSNGAGAGIMVRTVTDTPVPLGPMITFNPTQPVHIAAGYATPTALHVLGWRGVDLVDWAFPLGANGGLQQPTATVLPPSGCTSTIAAACFMRAGTTLHEAVTCNAQANGNPVFDLDVDGKLVASGPSNDLVVEGCLAFGPTFVLRTGNANSSQLRYGQTMIQLATPHPFALTTSATQASLLGPLAATPSNDGMVLVAYKLTSIPTFIPVDVYTGMLPISKLADLDQVPVPELSQQLTLNQLSAIYQTGHPDVGQNVVEYAGSNVTGDKVGLTAVGTDGKLLAYGAPVYTATSSQTTVTQAAVGMIGPSSLVAWDEKDAQPNTESVRGEMMLCSAQ